MNIDLFFQSLDADERKRLKELLADEKETKDKEMIRLDDLIKRNDISFRLRNTLLQMIECYEYVDEINMKEFKYWRNTGKKTEDEFKRLMENINRENLSDAKK